MPSRSSKAEQSENREGERRTPIRPRESMKDIIYNGVGEENPKAGHVDAYLFSVIILTSKLTVIIIIKEEEIEIFITSFYLIINDALSLPWQQRRPQREYAFELGSGKEGVDLADFAGDRTKFIR